MVSDMRTSLTRLGRPPPSREDCRKHVPHLALSAVKVGGINEGEVKAVEPLGSVATQVAHGVAERVAERRQLPADGFRHHDDLVAVIDCSLQEVRSSRQLTRGQEDHFAAGIELPTCVQADV